jgi:hypothetical protein
MRAMWSVVVHQTGASPVLRLLQVDEETQHGSTGGGQERLGLYEAHLWFAHCRFDGKNLICTDAADARTIERCYLAKLRAVVPALELTVTHEARRPKPEPAPVLRESAFKKTRVSQVTGVREPQRDLYEPPED